MRRLMDRPMLRVGMTLIIGLLAWVLLGYLATMPLGAIFGWSGHPAIPDAPVAVYLAVYLVIIPALALLGAWRLTRRLAAGSRAP